MDRQTDQKSTAGGQDARDGRTDLRNYLRVLVDEHEGVGHVVVAEVDDRGAHPRAHAALCLVQNVLLLAMPHPVSG